MPYTLFEVLGYSIYRRDRVNKFGGGVMAYINDNLNVIRELIWKIKKLKSFGQSRTQSPRAFWPAGERPERLWDNRFELYF